MAKRDNVEELAEEVRRVEESARRRSRDREFTLEVSPRDWRAAGELDYLYRSGELLAGDGDLPRVRDAIARQGVDIVDEEGDTVALNQVIV